jgi:hypothetical protein
MLGLMEKQLESKNIPYGYALCFNIGTSTEHIKKGAAVMVAPSLNETKAILYLCKI